MGGGLSLKERRKVRKLHFWEIGDSIEVEEDDYENVISCVKSNIPLYIDETGRIYNSGNIYIADAKGACK